MNGPITVKCLITVPRREHFDACTLALNTIRTGWPTAGITFYVNSPRERDYLQTDFFYEVIKKIKTFNADTVRVIRVSSPWGPGLHHAEWIKQTIERHMDGSTLVLVDGDTVWWKNCEGWDFKQDTLLAGYYVPEIWNDFAKCVSEPRIHTSCMVFPNTVKLFEAITKAYRWAYLEHGDYCSCDPFMPAVKFVNGKPHFWDSCANLFQMLRSFPTPPLQVFQPEHLECYDHLNSAAFFDVMHQRMDAGHSRNFAMAHDLWVKNPVPGLWKNVNAYYREKQIQAQIESPR